MQAIAELATKYQCAIRVRAIRVRRDALEPVDGKSIWALMSLVAEQGTLPQKMPMPPAGCGAEWARRRDDYFTGTAGGGGKTAGSANPLIMMSAGAYARRTTWNAPFGAGSQFDSISGPGLSA
jgi:hypothetical protein